MELLASSHNVLNYNLENHFGGLLESDATSKMVDKKIDAILARPEGVMCLCVHVITYCKYVCMCICMYVCVYRLHTSMCVDVSVIFLTKCLVRNPHEPSLAS